MLARLLPLFAMIALGLVAGRLRLFSDPPGAIGVLNRFALYLAFPLLIVAGLGDPAVALAGGAGFYLVHVVAAALFVPLVVILSGTLHGLRADRGAFVMGSFFGNIAYLGIPFCVAVFGHEVAGLAALSAAAHIVIGMSLGPVLLLRWSGEGGTSPLQTVLPRVARQPLVWAPLIGIAVRFAPDLARDPVLSIASPIGSAAGPVALFMLGLYLHQNLGKVARVGARLAALGALKLAVYPAVTLASVALVSLLVPLSMHERAVVVSVAAMPIAITTFSLAEEFETGQELLAQGIVGTTVAALVSLPLVAWWFSFGQ